MSGPPVSPSFKDSGMPGMMMGMLATMQPKAIPRKMGMRLGLFNRRSELPIIFSKWLMASSLPTTVTRSPICR